MTKLKALFLSKLQTAVQDAEKESFKQELKKINSKNYFALTLFVPSIISDVVVVVYLSNYSIVNTNVITVAKLICG